MSEHKKTTNNSKKSEEKKVVETKEKEEVRKPTLNLSLNQKIALIAGALILILILSISMLSSQSQDPKEFNKNLLYMQKSAIVMDLRDSPDTNANQKIIQCGVNLISDGFFAKTGKNLSIYACDNTGCLFTNTDDIKKEQNANSSDSKTNSVYQETISPEIAPSINSENNSNSSSNNSNNDTTTDIINKTTNTVKKDDNVSLGATNTPKSENLKLIPYNEVLSQLRDSTYFHIKYGKEEKWVYHPTYLEVYLNENSNSSLCKLDVSVN